MYEVKLNPMECASQDDVIYVWAWIMHLLWLEECVVCAVIDSEWIEWFLEWKFLKWFSKSKIKRAVERLLCCWILEMENWFLRWNKDRYLEINRLWAQVENELYSKYRWIWTYEDIKKYEEMGKFVRDMFKNFKL